MWEIEMTTSNHANAMSAIVTVINQLCSATAGACTHLQEDPTKSLHGVHTEKT